MASRRALVVLGAAPAALAVAATVAPSPRSVGGDAVAARPAPSVLGSALAPWRIGGGSPVAAAAAVDEKLARFQPTLPLAVASSICDRVLACGAARGFQPLAVVVLDAGGNMVAMKKGDGCAVMRGKVAEGKAFAAVSMGMSSRLIRDRMASRPTFVGQLSDVSQGRFVTTPGGVLVLDPSNGTVLGAVGVSGDTSDKDEVAAIEAVRAVALLPEPAAPADNWRGSSLSK